MSSKRKYLERDRKGSDNPTRLHRCRRATPEISQTQSVWNWPPIFICPERTPDFLAIFAWNSCSIDNAKEISVNLDLDIPKVEHGRGGLAGKAAAQRRKNENIRLCGIGPTVKPLALLLLLVISSAVAGEKPTTSVVRLPRPNSETFSFAQAEARKSEILSNAPSSMLESWKNPFMGFCIHIAKDDSVTVYNHFLKAIPDYSKPRPNQSIAEIKKLVDELRLEGNPAGVLITSDAPLRDSKMIHKMLEVLFVPSVQLFYVKSNELGAVLDR